eukprot:5249858-Amphidinium_carterae.1
MEMTKADILQFSKTLNYVLLHVTKQGSEPHSIMRRVMRQANGGHRAQQYSFLRTITQPTWDTNQYYKWLEDIGRYEAENGANKITEQVKIATMRCINGFPTTSTVRTQEWMKTMER